MLQSNEMRFFNTEGPIYLEHHCYVHVPLLSRIDLDEVLALIEMQKYFVLYARRQTGKTTVLGALLNRFNGSGRYRCVLRPHLALALHPSKS